MPPSPPHTTRQTHLSLEVRHEALKLAQTALVEGIQHRVQPLVLCPEQAPEDRVHQQFTKVVDRAPEESGDAW